MCSSRWILQFLVTVLDGSNVAVRRVHGKHQSVRCTGINGDCVSALESAESYEHILATRADTTQCSACYLPARADEEKVAAARRVLLMNIMDPNEGSEPYD